jgi:hypothetical protein
MSMPTTTTMATGAEPLAQIGSRLQTLERRVELLEAVQPKWRPRDWPPSPELVEQIKEITRSLFPGEVGTEIDFDPSEPDDPWLNSDVTRNAEPREYRELVRRWHEAVHSLGVEDATRFRVLVCPTRCSTDSR